jgi:hypothetical protein
MVESWKSPPTFGGNLSFGDSEKSFCRFVRKKGKQFIYSFMQIDRY